MCVHETSFKLKYMSVCYARTIIILAAYLLILLLLIVVLLLLLLKKYDKCVKNKSYTHIYILSEIRSLKNASVFVVSYIRGLINVVLEQQQSKKIK